MVVRHGGCEPVPEWTEVTEAQQSVEQAEKEQIVRISRRFWIRPIKIQFVAVEHPENSKMSWNI